MLTSVLSKCLAGQEECREVSRCGSGDGDKNGRDGSGGIT